MNFEEIDSAAGCEELLCELPQMFANFMTELEDCFKTTDLKHSSSMQLLKTELDKLQDQHIKRTSKKEKLKKAVLKVEKHTENDSSYFIYSEKELQDELEYQKKVVSYAKRKICLYQLLGAVEWNPECCKGRVLRTSQDFDLSNLDVYEQINALWDLI